MTDRIRTLTDEALAMHKELAELGIEQSKLVKKGADAAFETARASMELARDSQQRMAKRFVDAVAPKAEA